MQFDHLDYFVGVVEAGSISLAAERLHVAQPALSRVVQQLERELGQPLLKRTPKGVLPTAAGQRVYEDYLRMRRLKQGWYAGGAAQPQGEVSVYILSSFVSFFRDRVLTPFAAQYPQVRVSVPETRRRHVLANLKNGAVNLAVSSVSPAERERTLARLRAQGWSCQPLLTDEKRLLLSADHPLAQQDHLTPQQIKDQLTLACLYGDDDVVGAVYGKYFAATLRLPDVNSVVDAVVRHGAAGVVNGQTYKSWYFARAGLVRDLPLPFAGVDNQVTLYAVATAEASAPERLLYEYIVAAFPA